MGLSPNLSYMEIKDIVGKALEGKDYQDDIKDFDAEQLKELDIEIAKGWRAESEKAKAETVAFRKEKQRLEGNPLPEKKEDIAQSQLRKENLQLAREEFFQDAKFKLTSEELVQFDEEFTRLDSGKLNPKLITADLRKAFVAVKSDSLLDNQERMANYEKNADFHMANQAGGSGGQGSPDESKFSQAAKDIHKSWIKSGVKDKTLDDAQRLVDRGEGWKERNLSS